MTTKTHIIQQFETQVNCNVLLSPPFKLHDVWFAILPNIQEIKKTTKPSTSEYGHTKVRNSLWIDDIYYTQDTIKAFQQHNILFPQKVKAATNNIIYQSMGYNKTNQKVVWNLNI